jgi:predicted NBD/HSP70 family sugar kinase
MNVAIDLGGTNTRIAAYKGLKPESILGKQRIKTSQSYEDTLNELVKTIANLTNGKSINNIVISHAGVINRELNMVTSASNLPSYANKPLALSLRKEFGAEVIVENDVVVASLGQFQWGMHNMDIKNFVYATVSTGYAATNIRKVGNSLLIKPIEMGHNMIIADKKICSCGQVDCFEIYVGGKSISDRFVKDAEKIDDLRIWEESIDYLAVSFANLIRYFSPDMITIGGGIINGNDYVREKIELELKKQIRHDLLPRLRVSEFEDEIGLIGGLALISLKDKIANRKYIFDRDHSTEVGVITAEQLP